MPTFSRAFMRTASLPTLLATTSVAALSSCDARAGANDAGRGHEPVPVNGTFTIDANTMAVVVDQPSFTGDIVNPSFLPLNTAAAALRHEYRHRDPEHELQRLGDQCGADQRQVLGNGTTPAAAARNNTIGIAIGPSQNGGSGGTFSGSVINSGGIMALGGFVRGLDPITGRLIVGTPILQDFAPGIGIEIKETVTGSIVNTGAGGFDNFIFVGYFGRPGRLLPLNQTPFSIRSRAPST